MNTVIVEFLPGHPDWIFSVLLQSVSQGFIYLRNGDAPWRRNSQAGSVACDRLERGDLVTSRGKDT